MITKCIIEMILGILLLYAMATVIVLPIYLFSVYCKKKGEKDGN